LCTILSRLRGVQPHTTDGKNTNKTSHKGVPLREPVAGVAMGLVLEPSGEFVVLSDILGSEDALGDMDFKVGTVVVVVCWRLTRALFWVV
jgi:hypothetical protein